MKHPISAKKLAAILKIYLQGNSSPSEVKHVEEWIDNVKEPSERLLPIDQRIQVKEKVWDELAKHTVRSKSRRLHHVVSWTTAGVAASFVLWVVVSPVFRDSILPSSVLTAQEAEQPLNFSQVTNSGSSTNEIRLDDGSIVQLGQGSSMSFNDMKGDSIRLVNLDGEAFFQVARDEKRPFYVYTEGLVTKVLGTSFSIVSRGNGSTTTISVSSGLVSVSNKDPELQNDTDAKHLILHPNQQATFDPANNELKASLVAKPTAIRKHVIERLVFDGVAASAVLDSIAGNFGIPIIYDSAALRQCKITTAFLDEGLYEQLDIVSKILSGNYIIEGTSIRFKSEGCN